MNEVHVPEPSLSGSMVSPRIREVLACPECHCGLRDGGAALHCPRCGLGYPVVGGMPQFAPGVTVYAERYLSGSPVEFIRRFWQVPSPSYESPRLSRAIPDFLDLLGPEALVANVGSGGVHYRPNVLNVDLSTDFGTDVLADASRLPFLDGCLDGIISRRVLEHVRGPNHAVAEMHRVLKPGGRVWCEIPFLQGYHPTPTDFQRYTREGIADLFSEFEVEKVEVGLGPASTLSWILREFSALLFSGGNYTLYKAGERVFSYLFLPLKYLDFFLDRNPMAMRIASSFYLVGRKPELAAPSRNGSRSGERNC
jgi:SAM-dependent methyltransferase